MIVCVLATGCGNATPDRRVATSTASDLSRIIKTSGAEGETKVNAPYVLPPAPRAGTGPIPAAVASKLDRIVPSLQGSFLDREVLLAIAESGDGRLAWILSDLLRFGGDEDTEALVTTFVNLTGVKRAELSGPDNDSPWRAATDLLIAWDLPAPAGYREFKRDLFVALEPRWKPIFDDAAADIDWRLLSWGGVLIDDRPLGDKDRCIRSCIPALDDPRLTDAAGGAWYPDKRFVFGIALGGEYLALPKHQMEVHEMVNLTIAGRRLAVPYCTLCGSAEAYLTDRVAGVRRPLVMRTSGLLSLSNKVMYDLDSKSAFDTFTGRAVSGPLHRSGVMLPMVTTVVSTWGAWRAAHPTTKIVAEDGGIGRTYDLDPLHGRDDNGPIFPIRRADVRLPVHTQVLGVITPDKGAVAFPVEAAKRELAAGHRVSVRGVEVTADGGGLVAKRGGKPIAAHQAFWFAWAQFHPGTAVWTAQ